jgi:hypothetical protein
MMRQDLEHPSITQTLRTGSPVKEQSDHQYCGECGRAISPSEDTYECRTHRILCKDCLLMLHKRYV